MKKTCTNCGEEKPLSEYFTRKNRPCGYTSACKNCLRKKNREWYKGDGSSEEAVDRRKESARKSYYRHKEKISEHRKEYRASDIGKKANTSYVKRNRDRIRLWCRIKATRRRARLRGGGGEHTWEQWVECVERYGSCCLCCGLLGDAKTLTVDHVVPVFDGGSDSIENIQPLCKPCNVRKGTKTIDYRVEDKKCASS